MQFAGRDFLKMKAPPGYKAGVGRGAVGLDPQSSGTFLQKRGNQAKPAGDTNRFVDAEDEEAGRIFDAIEAKRRRKRPKRGPADALSVAAPKPAPQAQAIPQAILQATLQATPQANGQPPSDLAQPDLAQVSIEEWAQLPDVSDSTRWNKRLRETEQQTRRFYTKASIEKPAAAQELSEIQRPMLEKMIREQPRNEEGYLQLAKLEKMSMHMKRARKLIEQGTARIPHSERLWLASIDLHTGADARKVASQACQALPQRSPLWLKAVDVEPTQAAKQQIVQEALLSCPQSEELWLLAAELEPEVSAKQQILETGREFVDTPAMWLASARHGGTLEEARTRFPTSKEIWQESIKADESLVEAACKAVTDRQSWLEFMPTIDRDSLVIILAEHLKITLDEVKTLPTNIQSLVYSTMEPSEALYKQWSASDPQALERAIQAFPDNDELWIAYFDRPDHDWSKFEAIAERASSTLLLTIGHKLVDSHEYDRAVQWLQHASSLETYELYFAALQNTGASTSALNKAIEDGLAQWPNSADLVLAKAHHQPPQNRARILNDALRTSANPAKIWTAIIDSEPATARKRALLVQAVAQHPHYGPLWLRRAQLERLDGKSTTHILAEAHRQCPEYTPLWLEDLLATPPDARKRRLGEAMRQSPPSQQLLIYGAQLFAAQNNMDAARQWLAKARAPESVLYTNPFTT